jgi:hypothetical protein
MPRFVLLRHDCPPSSGKPSHWDLMLERDGALLTWSLPVLPAAWQKTGGATTPIAVTRLPDHRLAYLDYEGPVSGDRGEVRRVDAGECRLIQESASGIVVELDGAVVRGRWSLEGVQGQWTLRASDFGGD